MLVAVCDQLLGTSTPSWRKMVTPFSLPIRAVRCSHSTRSKGDFLPSVKNRSKNKPVPRPAGVFPDSISVSSDLPFNADFTVAIVPPRLRFGVRGRSNFGALLFDAPSSGRYESGQSDASAINDVKGKCSAIWL